MASVKPENIFMLSVITVLSFARLTAARNGNVLKAALDKHYERSHFLTNFMVLLSATKVPFLELTMLESIGRNKHPQSPLTYLVFRKSPRRRSQSSASMD